MGVMITDIIIEGNGHLFFDHGERNHLSIKAHICTKISRNDTTLTVSDEFARHDKTKWLTADNCIEYLTECDYSSIKSVKLTGSVTATFTMPFDDDECMIMLNDETHLSLTNMRSFNNLIIILRGKCSVHMFDVGVDTQIKPRHIRNLNVIVEGSGEVIMGDGVIESAILQVTGRGLISEALIEGDALLTVTNDGRIQCDASTRARIVEHNKGGSITVGCYHL